MSKLFTTLKHLEQRQKKSGPGPEQDPLLAVRSSSPAKAGRGKKIIAVLLFFVVSGVAAILFLPRFLTSQNRPGGNPALDRPTGEATAGIPDATPMATPKPGTREPEGADQQAPQPGKDQPVTDHVNTTASLPPATSRASTESEQSNQPPGLERLPERQKAGPFGTAGKPVPMSGKQPPSDEMELTQPTTVHNPVALDVFVSRRHKQLVQAAEESRNRGDFSEAARLYRMVWEESGDPLVANNLAASLMMLGKNSEALAILQQALEKHPGDTDLRYNLEIARTLNNGQAEN